MLRFILVLLIAVVPAAVTAQERRASHCIAIADALPGASFVHRASFGAALDPFTVRLSYVSHATFLIETPEGVTAATDYTGFLGTTDLVPDVVTMNRAHDSHWTSDPDPRIPHILQGWNPEGGAAEHYLSVGDMLVRNVSTDIRSGFGTMDEPLGNSIFVFEVAGLCIGHLGHLHHALNDDQKAALGRLDVVLAPVDGGYTLPRPVLFDLLDDLRSSIIIPMHWFTGNALTEFLAEAQGKYDIIDNRQTFVEVSLRDLPDRPTVMVLRPSYLRDRVD